VSLGAAVLGYVVFLVTANPLLALSVVLGVPAGLVPTLANRPSRWTYLISGALVLAGAVAIAAFPRGSSWRATGPYLIGLGAGAACLITVARAQVPPDGE